MKEPSDGTEMAHAAGHLNIESILKCPYCPEEDTLLFGEAALRCSRCGVHYPANGALATDEAQSGPPATAPPRDVGTERERPLSGPDTLRDCRAAGLKGEIFYWTDYSAVFHTLPLRLAVPLADMCVRIDGLSEAGEIFCILAKKEAER